VIISCYKLSELNGHKSHKSTINATKLLLEKITIVNYTHGLG